MPSEAASKYGGLGWAPLGRLRGARPGRFWDCADRCGRCVVPEVAPAEPFIPGTAPPDACDAPCHDQHGFEATAAIA